MNHWQPLIAGDLAERAKGALAEIANALQEPRPEWWPEGETAQIRERLSISLANGLPGIAVFLANYAQFGRSEEFESLAVEYLNQSLEKTSALDIDTSLYEGLAGELWALHHIGRLQGLDDTNALTAEGDEILLQTLDDRPTGSELDLVSGLAGLALYFLDRSRDEVTGKALPKIIHWLCETAESKSSGGTWFREPGSLPATKRRKVPDGYYDLGVAHGQPGILGVLGICYAAGIEQSRIGPLIGEGVSWLLDQKIPSDFPSMFPTIVVPGVDVSEQSRLAWCYGDAGIASILWSLGHSTGEVGWIEEARSIARHAVGRTGKETGVLDAGLCHGASGVGHIFNRLAHQLQDEMLADAAIHWYRRTLDFCDPASGVAGFSVSFDLVNFDGSFDPEWNNQPGLLCGPAGIGLALLAGLSEQEPIWDSLLLLGPPLALRTGSCHQTSLETREDALAQVEEAV